MAVKNKAEDATEAMRPADTDTIPPQYDAEPVKAEKAKVKETGAGFCCYIGPNIMGVIQSGTVYHGTKADALAAIAPAVEKYPLIASLVVDGETLPTDRIKVKTPGNLLFVNAKKLAAGKK